MPSKRPLLSRKTDLALLIFFCLHTFFTSCLDCLDLYPSWIHAYPPFPHLLALRSFYIDTYQDKFFVDPPPWFVACTWLELLYHVPTCIWAVRGLYRDEPLLPIGLIVWAVEVFITTLLCLVDIWSWVDRSTEVKWGLTGCYAPYLGISAWIVVVMYGRLKDALLGQREQRERIKEQ
ncbi:putative integral membrane protein [Talaromyces proteolyticus]|uniref:Efficient mitochondria targeting-associated protein 19 n=1 Tax=Talaromyces proteolyticus TaxID=1131652 RepID=A0AAD4KG18_9EURO|nr:putative integral membrane protein [Talaromyces proteolyticus]KAH8691483.1 putative integral membrane protein [Talaromyces proteolyticus]